MAGRDYKFYFGEKFPFAGERVRYFEGAEDESTPSGRDSRFDFAELDAKELFVQRAPLNNKASHSAFFFGLLSIFVPLFAMICAYQWTMALRFARANSVMYSMMPANVGLFVSSVSVTVTTVLSWVLFLR